MCSFKIKNICNKNYNLATNFLICGEFSQHSDCFSKNIYNLKF